MKKRDFTLSAYIHSHNCCFDGILFAFFRGGFVVFFFYNQVGIARPATHSDLIGISQFFSTNLGVSRFPNSMCGNPSFLFCFEIGKIKRHLTLPHGPCHSKPTEWAENKFYDWLNRRPWLNPLYTATQRVK